MIIPFRYLDIPNFDIVSQRLLEMVSSNLYITEHNNSKVLRFSKPATEYQKFDISGPTDFWNYLDIREILLMIPELKIILKDLEVTPLSMGLLIVKNLNGNLHSDPGQPSVLSRINWPIVNGTICKTTFYQLKDNANFTIGQNLSNDHLKAHPVYNAEDIESELGSYILTQPVALNTKHPHQISPIKDAVSERPDLPRLVLSIALNKDLIET